MRTDMKISGCGMIPEGEYEKISLSGSGRLTGHVKCRAFSSSGTCKGESIECAEKMGTSGTAHFSGDIRARCMTVSGTFACENLTATEKIKLRGTVRCHGRITAEEVSIKADGKANIGCIGGNRITISAKGLRGFLKKIPLLCHAVKNTHVQTSIEGDEISVAAVTCPYITGRTVRIGNGCRIDLVQYCESIEISRRTKIGKIEKIESVSVS